MSGDASAEPDFAILPSATVAIVGLGLMGGSLALALRQSRACRQVRGIARRPETVAEALARRVVDVGATELEEGVAGADVVVLAVPVRAIIDMIPQVGALMRPGSLLVDLGSTKREIAQTMNRLPPQVQAIGGHPMCGKESSGLESADLTLYRGATFALTPLPRTSPRSLALARELAHAVGAQPLVVEAEQHDRLVAAISHLPYLLAASLVATARTVAEGDPRVWQLAASGFRDTSRLAASDVRMMLDILMTNRAAIGEMIDLAQANLDELRGLITAEDEGALRERLSALQRQRAPMFGKGKS